MGLILHLRVVYPEPKSRIASVSSKARGTQHIDLDWAMDLSSLQSTNHHKLPGAEPQMQIHCLWLAMGRGRRPRAVAKPVSPSHCVLLGLSITQVAQGSYILLLTLAGSPPNTRRLHSGEIKLYPRATPISLPSFV